jgi:serine/threonine protein kinase
MSSPHGEFASPNMRAQSTSLSSLVRRTFVTEDPFDIDPQCSESEEIRKANIAKQGGSQWLPLIRLLSVIESQGILPLGSSRQPWDPRQLIWTTVLGKGSEAAVKRLTAVELPEEAVRKKYRLAPRFSSTSTHTYIGPDPRAIYQDLAVLTYSKNANYIIKLLAVDKTYSENHFSLVTELAELGTLNEYLANHRPERAQIKQFCIQVTSALGYLHSEGILHNDVKPENILIKQHCAKLADFGHAIFNYKTQNRDQLRGEGRLVGTSRWAAPEMLDVNHYKPNLLSPSSDIYSLGMVIAYSVGFDFPKDNEWKNTNAIFEKLSGNIPAASTWALPILEKSLQCQPPERFHSTEEISRLFA